MRYRYLVDLRRGISVFAIFSYGIAVLGTPQCPPPDVQREDCCFKWENHKILNVYLFLGNLRSSISVFRSLKTLHLCRFLQKRQNSRPFEESNRQRARWLPPFWTTATSHGIMLHISAGTAWDLGNSHSRGTTERGEEAEFCLCFSGEWKEWNV